MVSSPDCKSDASGCAGSTPAYSTNFILPSTNGRSSDFQSENAGSIPVGSTKILGDASKGAVVRYPAVNRFLLGMRFDSSVSHQLLSSSGLVWLRSLNFQLRGHGFKSRLEYQIIQSGSVTQLVEWSAVNRYVAGSSPA